MFIMLLSNVIIICYYLVGGGYNINVFICLQSYKHRFVALWLPLQSYKSVCSFVAATKLQTLICCFVAAATKLQIGVCSFVAATNVAL